MSTQQSIRPSIQQPRLGAIVRITGPVIDVSFAGEELPALLSALIIHSDQHNVTIEVLEHLDRHTVRGIAMEPTAGLRRNMTVGGHLRPAHLALADRVTRRAVYRYFRATGDAGVEVALLSLADHLATWRPNLQERRWARRLEVAETLLTHYFERHENFSPVAQVRPPRGRKARSKSPR